MASVSIAHISDTHLGYRAFHRADEQGRNLRALDIEAAYKAVVDDILSGPKPDLIVHTGDVFHHSRPTWAAMRCFIQQTRRLEALGVPIVVIAGNHDTPQLRLGTNAFSVLELALPAVHFVTGYEERTFDFPELNIHITAVPHGRLISGSLPPAERDATRRSILLTHGLAPTAVEHPRHEVGEITLDEAMLDASYTAILLGHWHTHERIRQNAWYAGSSERIGWFDRDHRPGWNEVEISDTNEVVCTPRTIKVRPMHVLDALDCHGLPAPEIARSVIETVRRVADEGSMVRIELLNVTKSERNAAQAAIRRDAGKTWLALDAYTRQDLGRIFESDTTPSEDLRTKTLPELFLEFCGSQEYPDDFREKFRLRGSEALERALQDAVVATGEAER